MRSLVAYCFAALASCAAYAQEKHGPSIVVSAHDLHVQAQIYNGKNITLKNVWLFGATAEIFIGGRLDDETIVPIAIGDLPFRHVLTLQKSCAGTSNAPICHVDLDADIVALAPDSFLLSATAVKRHVD
jgi:hypothetical protein